MALFIGWLVQAAIFGCVVMYGSVGETITERVGHLNLGTPGIMAIGGAFGFIGAYSYENKVENPNVVLLVLIPILCAFVAAGLAGLLYAFFTVSLLVNQNVVGLTMTIFGVGFAKFFGTRIIPAGSVATKAIKTNAIYSAKIPGLSELGPVGEVFFSYGFMVYLGLAIAILTWVFMKKSRVGLNLRAIGENPATADAAGINVTKYKYLAIGIGSGITGLGGVLFVLDYGNGTWATASGDAIEKLAWLSVALVIFSRWSTLRVIWGSFLFGLCFWAFNYVPSLLNIKVNNQIAQMLPYVVTILALIIGSLKIKRENQGPEYLGRSYFREER